ncbi:hypothetical protein [Winogradskyella endarachnes]|uniref:Uncharacterized protein n=1 Tax=Winogradskyella endarachnes TaxID=2681965 RepID=A0A6L6UAF9_9FLAO|nr:hypothetical protein [Winogradskyella endarachnes]MUU79330.1 hypothetical protein [Winogradskyella endarachnes]
MQLSFQFAIAQTKNEKEERTQLSEFPKLAKNTISKLPKNCKRFKYYFETDGDQLSFEVKFTFNKRRYSLEFLDDGHIADIESIVKLRHIPTSIRQNINSYFKLTFKTYKLIKLQNQYVYNSERNPSQFVYDVLLKKHNTPPNYEIIAEVKIDKQRELREFTFNNKGEFINYRIVNQDSYEHVLY